jgi:fucose 4-O-acetylase-like acetyltransferase
MPLFFIVSGVFLSVSMGKRGLGAYVENRVRTILYPYFLWGFLQLTLQMVFSRYTNGHPTIGDYLHLLYLPREVAQFWYLYTLFFATVSYAALRYGMRTSLAFNMALGVALYILSALIYQHGWKFGFFSDVFHYYLFVVIGDWAGRFLLKPQKLPGYESGLAVLVLLVPFAVVQYYFLTANLHHSVAKYMYVEYYQPLIFLGIALVGCTFIIYLTFYLQRLDALKWLTYLGRNSIYVYVSHVIAFSAVRIILMKIFHVDQVMILLLACIVAANTLPLLLYALSERFGFTWIYKLENKQSKAIPSTATSGTAD